MTVFERQLERNERIFDIWQNDYLIVNILNIKL